MVERSISFHHQGEEYQTWYKVAGNPSSRTRTPLVVAHGGPGLSHNYLLPLSSLATKFSIPVIFYDQIGNSRSTHLPSKPSSLWTIDLFFDELVDLLKHFHIQSEFDLLSHSWGGILGLEFEVCRQPERLRHLVLTNSSADTRMWNASTGELSKAFPDDVQKGLAVGVTDMEAYGKALRMFHKKQGCLVDPWPEELVYSMNQSISPSADISVAVGMIINRLDRIRAPIFDSVFEPFFRGIRQVKWVTMEKSSHTPMWEERERYMDLVNGFLSM
ncbi:proline iminopeptidase [Armillaria gallica]|uniref:Proline iminopeptidase n=1 Tax=Armillaria gallica TaxID=47427 RepID=A0A2H3DH63_ARMGA|nr:proline iminopeptidase [Armillaria gallica]